jgi:hypothetical protein
MALGFRRWILEARHDPTLPDPQSWTILKLDLSGRGMRSTSALGPARAVWSRYLRYRRRNGMNNYGRFG